MTNHTTPQKDRVLREFVAYGNTIKEILLSVAEKHNNRIDMAATELGVNGRTVWKWRKECGLPNVHETFQQNIEIKYSKHGDSFEEIIRNVLQIHDYVCREAARYLETDQGFVRDWCKKFGIQLLGKREAEKLRIVRGFKRIESEFAEYGSTAEEILRALLVKNSGFAERTAIELGINGGTMRRWCRFLGIQTMTLRQACSLLPHDSMWREKTREKNRLLAQDESWIEKNKEVGRRNASDPTWKVKIFRALEASPSRPEKILMDTLPPDVVYTGNRKFWVTFSTGRKKNPDFIIRPFQIKRKVIEVHSCWHTREHLEKFKGGVLKYPEDTNADLLVEQYRQVGVDCLVVWDHEILEDPDAVRNRIMEFGHG